MPTNRVRVVTDKISRPVRVVTGNPSELVTVVTDKPSEPVRVVTDYPSDPVRLASSPMPPTPPAGGLLLDLEADTGVTATGGFVDTWADQSGNGRDFTASGTSRPALTTDGGGYPCLQFDGINDWMLGGNWAALDNLDSFTVFICADDLTYAITKIGNFICADPDARGWYTSANALYISSDMSDYIYQLGPAPAIKTAIALEMISRTELHVYMNGVISDIFLPGGNIIGTGAGNYSNSEPVRIAVDGSGGSCDGFGSGNLYAIQIYAPAPDAATRAAIEAALMARYGV